MLRVEPNKSYLITLGECVVLLPSIICHKQAMCYHKRLHDMQFCGKESGYKFDEIE